MASCAAGKTFRVYGQYTSLVCKLMIKTWGHLFKANEKKDIKNTCEPSKNLTPFLVDFATSPFACMQFVPFLTFCTHFTWSPHVD